jgi:hypothetical protein
MQADIQELIRDLRETAIYLSSFDVRPERDWSFKMDDAADALTALTADNEALTKENERMKGAIQEWKDGICISQKYLLMIGELDARAQRAENERDNANDNWDLADKECVRLRTELAALREADRWIPCEEKMPEQSGRYLAYIHREATEVLGGNSDFMRIKIFMGGEWAYGTHSPAWINGELKDTVTHWRPLPAAPEV